VPLLTKPRRASMKFEPGALVLESDMFEPSINTDVSYRVGVMTMDRKFVKTFEKMTAGNPFGTMPRSRIVNDGATKATLQTIGAFSNMYNMNKEANIIDEELKYLQ